MSVEATLGDTVILAAYTEGYIATSDDRAPCPYAIGTREFDLWALGHIHRRLLSTDVAARVACGVFESDEHEERLPPCI